VEGRRARAGDAGRLGPPARGASVFGGGEHTQFLPVWLNPQAGTPEHPVPALLNIPQGWQVGDAAVVIAKGAGMPDRLRHDLTSALIDSGAAVLELHVEPGRERDLPGSYADALVTLRIGFGAGLVAVAGHGAAGPATLAAAGRCAPTSAATTPRWCWTRSAPRWRAGEVPPPHEAWAARAPLFCEALTLVLGQSPSGFVSGCARELVAAR
jgi:hypothetical protein